MSAELLTAAHDTLADTACLLGSLSGLDGADETLYAAVAEGATTINARYVAARDALNVAHASPGAEQIRDLQEALARLAAAENELDQAVAGTVTPLAEAQLTECKELLDVLYLREQQDDPETEESLMWDLHLQLRQAAELDLRVDQYAALLRVRGLIEQALEA